ncbi:MAG: NUDIX hydrolase [Ardenticatenia bacterium]|nr:NUDIX hydrolase [Ardenticatenia bacterium]
MRFCPECGTRLHQREVAGRERPVCPACGFVHYRNPVPIALAQATLEGRLLLVRRLCTPLRGYWAPPGGYVEYDEAVEDAVVRELKEETNLDFQVEELLNVYSRPNTGILFVVYRGRIVGGDPKPGDDASAVEFFAPETLPNQKPPSGADQLEHWAFSVIWEIIEDFRRRSR